MTTPDPSTPGQPPASQPPLGQAAASQPGRQEPVSSRGVWGAVARLLSLQLLTVIAVTAVITGIYTISGGHNRNQAGVGSSAPATTPSAATTSKPAATGPPASAPPAKSPPASAPPASAPPASAPPASATAPATPTTGPPPSTAAKGLKVDVLNQSGPGGTAATMASRVRVLGWTLGRVADFRGNVSATTVYYPPGRAQAARELAGALPGKPRVLPRFSTLSDKRLTIIVTG